MSYGSVRRADYAVPHRRYYYQLFKVDDREEKMLDLLKVSGQVDAMANHMAAEQNIHSLPAEELFRILQEFQAQYGVTFTRETFTLDEPTADGTFILTPDNNDPLPPIGCKVAVYGYEGQAWNTIVIDTNEAAGTYTVQVLDTPIANDKFPAFGNDHMAAMYDKGLPFGDEAV
jgi:hypothetical protein